MNLEPNSSRRYAFPVLTAVVLFGVFAVLLGALLGEANLVRRTQDALPQVTEIPPTEVAAALTPAPATTEAVPLEETPLVEVTVAPEVAEANEVVDIAPADAGSEGVVLDPAMVAAGQAAFGTICTACHGMNAQGVPGIGKDLVHSEFVNSLSDEDLAEFIIIGREIGDPLNTTGMLMPARGGNPAMTDEQIDLIVVYLRSLAAEAGVAPVHAGGSVDVAAADTQAQPDEAAPAPTRDPSFVPTPWAPPVPQTDNYIAVEDMPEDVQRLYRWASEGSNPDEVISDELFDSALLERGNEQALMDFLVNDAGYLDRRQELPYPLFGGDLSLPAPEGE